MPCYTKVHPTLGRVFICGNLGRPCRDCGDVASFLCDFPVGPGKTCDAPMCDAHAREIGPDLHYCAPHAATWDAYRESHGVERELARVMPFRLPAPLDPAQAPAAAPAASATAWGSATEHARYTVPLPGKARRRCSCGCGQRATHACMANGVALGRGCRLAVQRWIKTGSITPRRSAAPGAT